MIHGLKTVVFFFCKNNCVCMSLCVAHVGACVNVRGQLHGVGLSFHPYILSWDQTQLARLARQELYLMRHLARVMIHLRVERSLVLFNLQVEKNETQSSRH